MRARLLVLPVLCAGFAVVLLAPAPRSAAFSKIGGSLGETQRDVRVFDNFADVTANDNTTPAAQFPGWTGAELALWKAIVEWGSRPHGDGTGDPVAGALGDGGANFDALWSGAADGVGTNNTNVVSAISACSGGGTLAYCETPISDGWRIRFCDDWTWDDGPGTIGARFDLQGVMAHEYGHALGLGHSANGHATMAPSVGSGQTSIRSIHSDDIAGIQCVYGVASATKPVIRATVADAQAGTLTIHGSEFGGADNEVWFTSKSVTAAGADPIVRVGGVSASWNGTEITVAIPADAGPGDVMVNKAGSGGSTLSNAFPTDLVGSFGMPPVPKPDLVAAAPAAIEALIPGTARTIRLTGTDLDKTSDLLLDGGSIALSRWAIVDAGTIELDMPQAPALGTRELWASDGSSIDVLPVTIVAPATPKLELGSGDPLNVVDRDLGLTWRIAGTPGRVQRVYASLTSAPSTSRAFSLEIGGSFTNLYRIGEFTIPSSGWLELHVPSSALPDPGAAGTTFYAQSIELALPRPFRASNVQSMRLVR